MKWVLIAAAALVLLGLVIAIVGALLPRTHVASRATTIHQSADVVFAVIRNFGDHPGWRHGVDAIDLLPLRDGRPSYREKSRHGAITYIVVEEVPGQRLVTKIADEDLPFGGTWTIELSPRDTETTVRITERGEVKNPFFRFMARFVFGYTGTMEAYLRDLAAKFGEQATLKP
jgi:hypothetical protein